MWTYYIGVDDIDRAEAELRGVLALIHVRRPMERVIYNMLAAAIANTHNDTDRALLHATHNLRDLEAADCPPSVANVYRVAESRIYLARRDYRKAAEIYEQLIEHAHTTHAASYRGYAALAAALQLQSAAASSHDAMREHLRAGLAAMRAIPAINFFVFTPEARAEVCALALREGKHGPRPLDHGHAQVALPLIEHAGPPDEHVDAVAAVDVRHGPRGTKRLLLRAEGQRAQGGQAQEIGEHDTQPVVRAVDPAGPGREAAAEQDPKGVGRRGGAEAIKQRSMIGEQHPAILDPLLPLGTAELLPLDDGLH